MKKGKLFFNFLFLFIFEGFVLIKGNAFVKFTNNADLDGYICSKEWTRFEHDGLNKVQCLSLCAERSSCFGVSHDQVKQHCVGCGDKFLMSTSALSLNGMQYYERLRPNYIVVTEKMSRDGAKAHCEGLGGHLVDIRSVEEQFYIEYLFRSVHNTRVWIGASRKSNGGSFYWEDDTLLANNFANWETHQPESQNCVLMNWSGRWKWHDYYCSVKFQSLCKFE